MFCEGRIAHFHSFLFHASFCSIHSRSAEWEFACSHVESYSEQSEIQPHDIYESIRERRRDRWKKK